MQKSKVLSIVAAAAMLVSSLVFSTPVYATSVTTTTEVLGAARTAEEAQVLGAARASVESAGVTVGAITEKSALDTLKNTETIANIIVNSVKSGVITSANASVNVEQITIVDSMEVTAKPGVEVSEANPLFVTFSFPGITASTKAYVLHYGKSGWEVVPTTVLDGKVIGKFTSLSPVALVVEKDTLSSSVLGATRSPRTGDNRAIVIGACACLLAVSLIVDRKRKLA